MTRSAFLAGFFLLGIGCQVIVSEDAKSSTETLCHGGVERTYHVRLPPGFTEHMPAPLVIALHGGGGRGRRFDLSVTQRTLTAAADKRGVVLVFPEGIDKQWRDGRTDMLRARKPYDDVGFISTMIDTPW